MNNYNYLLLFETLTTKEKRLFADYLKVFCAKKKILLQIHAFYEQKSKRKTADLKKDGKAVFGSESASDYTRLSNGLSDLHITLKDFLVQQKILNNPREYELIWSEVLEEKQTEVLKDRHNNKQIKSFTKPKEQDIWHAYYKTRFYHDIYFRNGLKTGKELSLIETALQSLEDFYKGLKLKYAVEILNIQQVTGHQIQNLSAIRASELINTAQSNSGESIIIQFYAAVLALLTEATISRADELLLLIKKQKYALPRQEQLIGVICISNFLAKQISKGEADAFSRALSNYKFGIEENLLTQDQVIDKTVYENIINVACLNKDFKWAETFALKYKNYLPDNIRESSYRLSLASIAFDSGKKKDVFSLLGDIKSVDVFQDMRIRSLKLRCYYELNELEEVDKDCESFRRFVQRNQLSENNQKAALNFISIFKKLIGVQLDHKKLKQKIEETEHLFFRSWLLEKVA